MLGNTVDTCPILCNQLFALPPLFLLLSIVENKKCSNGSPYLDSRTFFFSVIIFDLFRLITKMATIKMNCEDLRVQLYMYIKYCYNSSWESWDKTE